MPCYFNSLAKLKLADFGFAEICKPDEMLSMVCGTPGYVAPEILYLQKYDHKVDIWSLGVVTYIMLCGFPPFYHQNAQVLLTQIKSGKYSFPSPYWDLVSDQAKDFITKMLVVNPEKRLSVEECLKHEWIVGESNSDLMSSLQELKKV